MLHELSNRFEVEANTEEQAINIFKQEIKNSNSFYHEGENVRFKKDLDHPYQSKTSSIKIDNILNVQKIPYTIMVEHQKTLDAYYCNECETVFLKREVGKLKKCLDCSSENIEEINATLSYKTKEEKNKI